MEWFLHYYEQNDKNVLSMKHSFFKSLSWTTVAFLLGCQPAFCPPGNNASVKKINAIKKKKNNSTSGIKSVTEAFQMAYIYNTDIQTAFNSLKMAQENCFRMRSEWMPNITANINASKSPTKNFITNNVGTLENVIEDSYIQKQENRSCTANFQIVQNLYNGGATRAKNEQAFEAFKEHYCDFKNTIQNVFNDVLRAFVDMCCSREYYLISKMREKSLSVLREMARNRYVAGDQRMVDVSLANAQCIRQTIDVNNARLEYMSKKLELEALTGSIFSDTFDFPVPLEVDLYSVQDFTALCLKSNPVIQKQVHTQRAARCRVNESASNFLPKVELQLNQNLSDTYQFDHNDNFESFPYINSTRGFSAAIGVAIPILDGGGFQADYRRTELEVKGTRLNSEAVKRNLIREVKSTIAAYQLSLQNVVSAREALKEQGAAFASSRQEYALGATTMVDLLGLEDQYVHAIRTLVDALGKVVQYSYSLKRLLGQLTPNMVHIQSINKDIVAYRKSFQTVLFALGENQSKTSLYEQSPLDKSKGGSDILKGCDEGEGALDSIESALKEGIDWYPAEGITLEESSSDSLKDLNPDILQELLLKQEGESSSNSNAKNMDIEALMNAPLVESIENPGPGSDKNGISADLNKGPNSDVLPRDGKENKSKKRPDVNSKKSKKSKNGQVVDGDGSKKTNAEI